jgi:Flp pilus assembly pilin Flp
MVRHIVIKSILWLVKPIILIFPKGAQMEGVIRRFYEDASGASSTEYAILVSCLAVVIAAAVVIFGQGVKGLYTKANDKFP